MKSLEIPFTIARNFVYRLCLQIVMQYLYSGGCHSLNVIGPADLLELMAAASFFQLDDLLRYTEARCSQIIDVDNIVATYIHAKVCNPYTILDFLGECVAIKLFRFFKQVYGASKLLEYCQGFLLKNMVALLTCSESVKRLLFAKKIPNHDVINGLLATLQGRIQFNQ